PPPSHAHTAWGCFRGGGGAVARPKQFAGPFFLSIGYSACHWCHVMEHESFEDTEVAQLLNEHFVSIKVDREERPDLDQIYMTALQTYYALTGQRQGGGWPLSMFLTPDLQPFFGGTYFPPDDRYGGQLPPFKRILLSLIRVWQEQRQAIQEQAGHITEHLQEVSRVVEKDAELQPDLLRHAAARLRQVFDPTYGGFGNAPKFPHPMDLRMLLRAWRRFGD